MPQSKLCSNDISQVNVQSPIGTIYIESCVSGLHSVKLCDKDDSSFNPDIKKEVCLIDYSEKDTSLSNPNLKQPQRMLDL